MQVLTKNDQDFENLVHILAAEGAPMVYLNAFFDESGTDDKSRAIGIGGFVMQSENWLPFCLEWSEVLNREPKIEYFHSVEANSFTYQFDGWSREARDEKVIALLDLICKYRPVALPQAIHKAQFESARQKYPTSRALPDPYLFCLANQFVECADLAEAYPPGTRVSIVLENNDEMRHYANAAYEAAISQKPRLRACLANFAFADKKQQKALQAADFLTYEITKNFGNRIVNRKTPLRKPLQRLMEHCPFRGIMWEEDQLDFAFSKMVPELGV